MNLTVCCSICCEEKEGVELCTTCVGDDKRVCEECAVAMHAGCTNKTCNCFGFKCAFCRRVDKTEKAWTETSVLYWQARATDLADRLEHCAQRLEQEQMSYAHQHLFVGSGSTYSRY